MYRLAWTFTRSCLPVMLLITSVVAAAQMKGSRNKSPLVKRGEYLVNFGSCADCHTPKVMTPMGPVPDTTRTLSGHPASDVLAEVPPGLFGPTKWGALTNNHFTAWVGPWGTSFARNLTPDTATGLGSWTEAMFIKTIRTGKHMGEGRDLLPPMPWQSLNYLTDADLKAVWAYLRTVKPVENAIPDPIDPAGATIPTPKPKPKE